jgi:hypothetical protein
MSVIIDLPQHGMTIPPVYAGVAYPLAVGGKLPISSPGRFAREKVTGLWISGPSASLLLDRFDGPARQPIHDGLTVEQYLSGVEPDERNSSTMNSGT